MLNKRGKPLYVVKIMFEGLEGYFSKDHSWKYSPLNKATYLTHKEARVMCGKMKRLGYKSVIEKL